MKISKFPLNVKHKKRDLKLTFNICNAFIFLKFVHEMGPELLDVFWLYVESTSKDIRVAALASPSA